MKGRDSNSAAAGKLQSPDLYDADFFAWTRRTAQLLRQGHFREIDVEHTAEEIEDMGKRDLKELNSRVQVLLAHLLKWKLQPSKRSPSWRRTIGTQRLEIEAALEQSPSLASHLSDDLPRNYARALKRAVLDTNLPAQTFPPQCPFSLDQVLDEEFLPD
jgi:hypothetical protein